MMRWAGARNLNFEEANSERMKFGKRKNTNFCCCNWVSELRERDFDCFAVKCQLFQHYERFSVLRSTSGSRFGCLCRSMTI